MTTFTIDEQNQITAFATAEAAAASATTPFDTFTSQKQLAELAARWPTERLLTIWNSLPGVVAVKKFKDSKAAVRRIWTAIQSLGEPVPPTPAKAVAGAHGAQGAPAKGRSVRKATSAKPPKKGKKSPLLAAPVTPREGSKTAQVVALLQRKNGASLVEIVEKMGWQQHTVRGFMAGAMKKAGYKVESFKPDGGSRSYRILSH